MNESHVRFADKYFETLNASLSAEYAGFAAETSKQEGWRLLQRDDVQTYLSNLRSVLSEKTGITQQRVLNEIARIAFADIRNYYTGDNNLKSICDLEDDEAAALASVKSNELYAGDVTIGNAKEIKLHDKLAGLEKLARHLGLYEKDNSQQKPEIVMPAVNVYNQAPPLANSENDLDV